MLMLDLTFIFIKSTINYYTNCYLSKEFHFFLIMKVQYIYNLFINFISSQKCYF